MEHAPATEGTLSVRVVTPEGVLYKGDASFVAAPGSEGELGVLPSHTPLLSSLGAGVLRIDPKDGGSPVRFAIRGGFLQVVHDTVTLLVTEALAPEQVDVAALAAERTELLKKLQHPESDEAFAALREQRRWLEARERLG